MAKNYFYIIHICNKSEKPDNRKWSKILQTCSMDKICFGIRHHLGNHTLILEIIRSTVVLHTTHPLLTSLSPFRVFPCFSSVSSSSPLTDPLFSFSYLVALPSFHFGTLSSPFLDDLSPHITPPSLLPAFCAISNQYFPILLVPSSFASALSLSDHPQEQHFWFVPRIQ